MTITPEQLRDMQPGPELDRIFAEAAGIKPIVKTRNVDGIHIVREATYPAYSTSGDGMLAVIEEMRERGIYIIVDPCSRSYLVTAYLFKREKRITITEYTAPHAVILAAIRALWAVKEGQA